jgi:hypothetical protein
MYVKVVYRLGRTKSTMEKGETQLRIYLAAAYSRHSEMRGVRTILEAMGYFVTSRWINGEHEVLEGQSHQMNRGFAEDDWEDLMNADVCIFFSSNGNQSRGRGGRHVEFGLALARGTPILVIGMKENVFHWLPGVEHFETLEAACGRLGCRNS